MKRDGFTLFKMVLALALLGISLLVLVQQSADNTRADADRAARLVAHRTLRNEVQRLRAADPMAGTYPATYFTDRSGNRVAGLLPGSQTVTLSRRVLCQGGSADRDNATAPAARFGCNGAMPLAEFTIRVRFPSRYTDDGTAAVEQTVTLWPGDRHGTAWTPAS